MSDEPESYFQAQDRQFAKLYHQAAEAYEAGVSTMETDPLTVLTLYLSWMADRSLADEARRGGE